MKTVLLLLSFFCLHVLNSNAQMVGLNAYLKGNYVEVGVNGLFGYEGVNTVTSPPLTGMHQRSGGPDLFGFVANPQMDGWVNYDGDFYTPGSPENGWGIEIFDTTATDTINFNINNNLSSGDTVLTGAITSFTYSGGYSTIVWEGNYGLSGYDLDITVQYDLYDTDLFYTTTVTIENNGSNNIEALYYLRNIDPDNNQTISGSFTTTNTIVGQQFAGDAFSSVKAEQSTPWVSTCAFFSADTNARVAYGGFSNRDASDIWNTMLMPSSTNIADEAISIVFKGENLIGFTRASGSSTLQFKFETAFGQAALDELEGTLGLNELHNDLTRVYPNPVNDRLTLNNADGIEEVNVYDVFGKLILGTQVNNLTNVELNTCNWSKGTYYISVKSKNSISKRKLIKL